MHNRNVVSWSTLMTGLFQKGFAIEVLGLFKTMVLEDNLCPNEYILTTTLKEGLQCHGYVLKTGLLFHQYVKNALVRMYSTCSDVEGATRVLNSIPGSDIVTFNSIIHGLLDHGYLSEGLELGSAVAAPGSVNDIQHGLILPSDSVLGCFFRSRTF
ncbi:hypothetical protein RJ639_030187 [Escallonia herrerae]|uniref:Pentatricopeptide repeat-containing protein n=1 Tax=Escallonia herrerae TaxID=1293975 RepID=A0AA88WYI1_9ASTE|nr:hypothetical protein RJ639_030187 [Escallonia herrerae]